MQFLKRLMTMRPHRHDFDMEFNDDDNPLAWTFRCKCGDTVRTLSQATYLQGRWTLRCEPL